MNLPTCWVQGSQRMFSWGPFSILSTFWFCRSYFEPHQPLSADPHNACAVIEVCWKGFSWLWLRTAIAFCHWSMLNTLQLALTEDRVICQHSTCTAERVQQSSDAISRFCSALRGPSFPQCNFWHQQINFVSGPLACDVSSQSWPPDIMHFVYQPFTHNWMAKGTTVIMITE